MIHVLVLKYNHRVLTYMTETKVNTNKEIYKFVISKILKQSLQ
jgi:CO dehydrogenase/acetyl-CoA synthase delta subunit